MKHLMVRGRPRPRFFCSRGFAIPVLLLIFNFQFSILNSQPSPDDYSQHTSWGFTTGANLLSYSLNLESAVGAPDRATPGLGADFGLFLDYHVSEAWAIRFAPSASMEHIRLYKNNDDGHLISFALDLSIALEFSFEHSSIQAIKHSSILLGPYTHFVLASTLYGSDYLTNPYSRYVADDPVTERPYFAMGDLSSGLLLAFAYQLPSSWFLQLDLKYGITDLLNTDTHRLYVRPFKISLSAGHSF